MKRLKSVMPFAETSDIRDGLFPGLRYALFKLKAMCEENNGKFRCSKRITQSAGNKYQTNQEEVYDAILHFTWPRSQVPLFLAHGNVGFLPAMKEYTELCVSDFYREISEGGKTEDFNTPLFMPFPYGLVNGAVHCSNPGKIILERDFERDCLPDTTISSTLPSHNLGEVIDATIALIKNPTLETNELLQFIKGPDLLIGGEIVNSKSLGKIYEKGVGVIKIKITPQKEISDQFRGGIFEYCRWYSIKNRKRLFKNEQILSIRYDANFFDGKTAKRMSLKEILQNYIDYYKTIKNDLSDEEICKALEKYKKLSAERKTKIEKQ